VLGFSLAAWQASQQAPPYKQGGPSNAPEQSRDTASAIIKPVAKKDGGKGSQNAAWQDYLPERVSDWLLVVFNGLLALFTWRLWISTAGLFRVTKIAADAARDSADALVSAESAHVSVKLVHNNVYEAAGKFGGLWPNSPQMGRLSTAITVTYTFKNFGKTPAILLEVNDAINFSRTPPGRRTYAGQREIPPEGTIIGADKTSERSFECRLATFLEMKEASELAKGNASIYFWGRAVYADIFEREIEHTFMFRFAGDGSAHRLYMKTRQIKTQRRDE
jgi:hypothetical protein